MKCLFCPKRAEFKCSCKMPYLCSNHLGSHLSENGMHFFEPFNKVLENSRLTMLRTKVIANIQKIKESKTDFIIKTKSLINVIQKLHSDCINQLNSRINDYCEILQHEKFCESEMANIEKIETKEIIANSILIDDIEDKINKLYSKKIVNYRYEPNIQDDHLFENYEIVKTIYEKTDKVKVRVNKCKCELVNNFVIIKETLASSVEDLEPFIKEANIYKILSGLSKNFLIYYGQKLSKIKLGGTIKFKFELVIEFIKNSLKEDKIYRKRINNPYTEDEINHILVQCIKSFQIMRHLKIMHCDIKPSNILVTSDLTIKIIDFDVSKNINNDQAHFFNTIGTLDFMAPEIRDGKDKDLKAIISEGKTDVFSLGMTILYLLLDGFEKDLNLELNRYRLSELIENVRYLWLKNILKKMLDFNYKTRASFEYLIGSFTSKRDRSVTLDS